MVGASDTLTGEMRYENEILVRGPEGKGPLWGPGCGCENDDGMDPGGGRVEECGLGLSGSVAGSCEHGGEPSGSMKGRKFCDWLSDF